MAVVVAGLATCDAAVKVYKIAPSSLAPAVAVTQATRTTEQVAQAAA
jgi:hypothetical protein